MLAIKTRERLTFPEARARARLTFNVSSRTYAAAAGNTRHRTAASSESLHDSFHPSSSSAPATSAPKTVDVTKNDRAPPSNPPATKRHLPRPDPAASQPHSPTLTPTKPAKQQKQGDTCVTRAQVSPGAKGPTMPPDKPLHKGKPPPALKIPFLALKIPSSMCTGVLRRIKRVLPMQAFGNLLHVNSVCDFCCSASPSTCVVYI